MCMTEQSACGRRRFHTECVKNHGWHIDQPFICAYYTYIYLFVMFLRCVLFIFSCSIALFILPMRLRDAGHFWFIDRYD